MPQEQLFKSWRMADQAADSKLAEPEDGCIKVIGVDVEAHVVAIYFEAMNTGQVGKAIGGSRNLRADRGASEVSQLSEGARLHHAPKPDDAQPVAQRFDFREYVARKQHRSSVGFHLTDAILEYRLHQR